MKKTCSIIALLCLVAVIAIGATSGLKIFSPGQKNADTQESADVQTYLNQGKSYLQAHNILAARDRFQLAVTADPANQEANLLYGVTRVFAVAEEGQALHTSGLDSVREILELAGIVFQTFNIYGSEMTVPEKPAATTPRTGKVLDFLKARALPEIDGAIANLEKVSSTAFQSIITPAAVNKSTGADIVVDYADALVIKSLLNAAKCKLNLLMVYGLDASLPDIQAEPEQLMTYKQLFQDAGFLAVKDAGRLTAARAALIGFIDAYTSAVPLLKARTDGAHHLFVVDVAVTNEPAHISSQRLERIQNLLNDLRASLDGPHLFAGSAPEQNRNVDLSRLFNAGAPINIRAKLADNAAGTVLPDSTINGLFPQGLTGQETFVSTYSKDILGVMFSGREKPFIHIHPKTIYTSCVDGSCAPQGVTVSNRGTADLHVASLTLTGPNAQDFSLTPGSCGGTPTLAPGAFCAGSIILKPTASNGEKTATLQAASDDISRPIKTAAIWGFLYNHPVSVVSVSANTSSASTSVGTKVTFTSQASGGSGYYEYQYKLRNPAGVWSVARAYSATPSWAWNTAGLATGAYKIEVWARNIGSTASWEAYKNMSYTLAPPVTSVTLTSDAPSPQPVGKNIVFSAAASGGSGAYEYQFKLRNAAGVWSLAQGYGTTPSWTWSTAGLAAGVYKIEVWTRNVGSTASSEAYKNMSYTLDPPASAVTLTSDAASPQSVGNRITFTAAASGGSGSYEYQYKVRNPAGVWSIGRSYAAAPSWLWNTSGLTAGVYKIEVWTRNAGSLASVEAYKNMSYTLRVPVTEVSLNPDQPSPQARGAAVTFTAAASGGSGSYVYQFRLRTPSGVWSVARDYSSTPAWTWNTTVGQAAGSYQIEVWAKNAGSNAVQEAYKKVSFTLQ